MYIFIVTFIPNDKLKYVHRNASALETFISNKVSFNVEKGEI